MHRIYLPSIEINKNILILSDSPQLHHLKDVLRIHAKEQVTFFDGKSNEYLAELQEISENGAIFTIKGTRKAANAPKYKLTIACAIPKNSKIEDIIDKLTQLGVYKIIPLKTKRVIVKLDTNKKENRLKRWRQVAINASQQSQRNTLPIIGPLMGFDELMRQSSEFELKMIPTLEGERKNLRELLPKTKPETKNILVLIGPEGDFTPEEILSAKKAGFIPVSLGKLVLRVETAAVAVASFIKLYEND